MQVKQRWGPKRSLKQIGIDRANITINNQDVFQRMRSSDVEAPFAKIMIRNTRIISETETEI